MIPAIYAKIRCIAYLGVDWDFTPPSHPPSSRTGVDTSGYTDRSDGQVNIRPELKKSSVSSPSCLGRSEDLNPLKISPSQKAGEPAASSSNGLDRSGNLTTRASPFISALDMFNEIVPNCDSKKIRPNIDAMERFQRDKTKCLGNTSRGIQCRCRNRSRDGQEIEQRLTALAARPFKNTQRCVEELHELIDLAICPYQCSKVKRRVGLLVSPDPRKEETIKAKAEELPDRILTRDESSITEGQKAQSVVSPVALSTPKITYWLRERSRTTLVYFPDFRPYQTKRARASIVTNWVIKQAERPLTRRQCKAGYLYVYWNKATFGIYKIGFTTLDVDERLKGWESQCKHTAQKLYQSPFEVKNVERLEKLVHAELKEFRVKEYGCHGCLGNHDEWFKDVDFEVIRESIAFWTKWIMEEPYEEVKGKWLLKEDAKKGLPQLCNMLSVLKAKERKAKSITITARRHNLRPRFARSSSSSYNRANW